MNRPTAFLFAMLLPAATVLADEPKPASPPPSQSLAFTITAEQAQTVYQIISEHAQEALKKYQADQAVLSALMAQAQANDAAQKNPPAPQKPK